MEFLMVLLLAVIAGEVWVLVARGRGPGDKGDEMPKREETAETESFEKRWREGIDAMMGYDLRAARAAVRRDEDET